MRRRTQKNSIHGRPFFQEREARASVCGARVLHHRFRERAPMLLTWAGAR